MELEFWSGIAIGGIISLLASIAANIYNSKVLEFLENRKVISKERRRAKVLQFDTIVRALHSGTKDRHVYLLMHSGAGFLCLCVSMSMGGALMAVFAVVSPTISEAAALVPPDFGPQIYIRYGTIAVMLFNSMAFLMLGARILGRCRRIQDALDHFTEYDEVFRSWDKGSQTDAQVPRQ